MSKQRLVPSLNRLPFHLSQVHRHGRLVRSYGVLMTLFLVGWVQASILAAPQNFQSGGAGVAGAISDRSQGIPPTAQAGQAGQQTVPISAPEGFPLDPAYENYVDQVLAYWESSSGQVERLRCQFNRFTYDSGVCNYVDPATGQMVAHEVAGGLIKYESPDRAIIEVDKKRIALPPSTANPNLEYRDLDAKTMENQRERYVSSGDAIYFFDYAQKQLIKQNLPVELQGQGIKNSPLPFLFGAKAAELKARYWIRPITPEGVEKQWWLEVFPKRRQDAEHYSRAVIVLAGDEFLPVQIQLFAPDHNPVKIQLADGAVRPAILKYQIYDFYNSEKNFDLGLNIVRLWRDEFAPRPQTLLGWKLVEKEAPTMAGGQVSQSGSSPAGSPGVIPR
jgi:TIGR03009 family protein